MTKYDVSGIYAIRNNITGHQYIGSAVNIRRRWNAHRHSLKIGRKVNPRLHNAWHKYGAENFSFVVLLQCTPANLLMYEQSLIDFYKPRYNIREKAESNLGVKHSAETNHKKHVRHEIHTVNGILGSIKGLARHFGVVSPDVACIRVQRGMSIADAVTLPPMDSKSRAALSVAHHIKNGTHAGRKVTYNGETANLKAIVEKYSACKYRTVLNRLNLGWEINAAIESPLRYANV